MVAMLMCCEATLFVGEQGLNLNVERSLIPYLEMFVLLKENSFFSMRLNLLAYFYTNNALHEFSMYMLMYLG